MRSARMRRPCACWISSVMWLKALSAFPTSPPELTVIIVFMSPDATRAAAVSSSRSGPVIPIARSSPRSTAPTSAAPRGDEEPPIERGELALQRGRRPPPPRGAPRARPRAPSKTCTSRRPAAARHARRQRVVGTREHEGARAARRRRRESTNSGPSTCPPTAITRTRRRAPPRTRSGAPAPRASRLRRAPGACRTNQRSPAASTARASCSSDAPACPGKCPAAKTCPKRLPRLPSTSMSPARPIERIRLGMRSESSPSSLGP